MDNSDDSMEYDDDDFEDYSSDGFEAYNESPASNIHNCSQKKGNQESIHLDQSHTLHYKNVPSPHHLDDDETCSLTTFSSSIVHQGSFSIYDQYRSKLSTPYTNSSNITNNVEETISERACQYNDDHQDIATITDDIKQVHRSVQCSNGVDDTLFYYTIDTCQQKDMTALKKITTNILEKSNIPFNLPTYNAQRSSSSSLQYFLNRVASTMEILVCDNIEFEKSKINRANRKNEDIVCIDKIFDSQKRQSGNDPASKKHCELRLLFEKKKIVALADSKIHNSSFLSMHVPNDMYSCSNDSSALLDKDVLAYKSLIAIWSNDLTNELISILIGEGVFRSVCQFTNSKFGYLVICGTNEGILYLWNIADTIDMDTDIIELNATIASSIQNLKANVYLPCYQTDWLEDSKKNHFSPIISLVLVPEDGISNQICSNQVVSLDESGKIIFWILQSKNISSKKTPYLSQLRIMNTMHEPPIGLYFSPHESNRYFVSLSNGEIRVRSIYGESQISKKYTMSNVRKEQLLSLPKVTTIQFSPFQKNIFLVGCNENYIFLFHESFSLPLLTLDPYSYVCEKSIKLAFAHNQIDIRWSHQNACVFFVLFSSYIYVYDLSVNEQKPIMNVDITGQEVNFDDDEKKQFMIHNKVEYDIVTFDYSSYLFRCKNLSQVLGLKDTPSLDDTSILFNAFIERKKNE